MKGEGRTSQASCKAITADDWNRRSVLKSCAISRTNRWNGNFRINNSVDFWYRRISRRATVPGRKRWGFLIPPVAGADFRAALVANCFRGALPPVDLRAVCFVRAIASNVFYWTWEMNVEDVWIQKKRRQTVEPYKPVHSFVCIGRLTNRLTDQCWRLSIVFLMSQSFDCVRRGI